MGTIAGAVNCYALNARVLNSGRVMPSTSTGSSSSGAASAQSRRTATYSVASSSASVASDSKRVRNVTGSGEFYSLAVSPDVIRRIGIFSNSSSYSEMEGLLSFATFNLVSSGVDSSSLSGYLARRSYLVSAASSALSSAQRMLLFRKGGISTPVVDRNTTSGDIDINVSTTSSGEIPFASSSANAPVIKIK